MLLIFQKIYDKLEIFSGFIYFQEHYSNIQMQHCVPMYSFTHPF